MKRILVTGACGSIGDALVSELLSKNNKVCVLDNSEDKLFQLNGKYKKTPLGENLRVFVGDVRDKKRMCQAMDNVQEVYHCAALKHVELSEYNPFEALNTNVIGTNNVIEAAIEKGVQKLLITSSDKAVNPSSTMGASKLLAEKLAISANNYTGENDIRIGCVRFGNVWNTNGSVGRIFKSQVLNNQDITLTNPKMSRFFISIQGAIDLCINSCESLVGGETFVSNMGTVKIGEIANAFKKYNESIEIREIGFKPGEKLYEELFTEVESERTYVYNNMYVILPDSLDKNTTRYKNLVEKYVVGNPVKEALRSDSQFAKEMDASLLVDSLMNDI